MIADLARARWPRKTALELALRADVSQRQAEKLLADRAAPSGETLAKLIVSDVGFALIAALMDDLPATDRPEWWQGFHRQVETARIEAEIAALRQRQAALGGAGGGGAG